jgi:hypothetical protein
MYRQMYTSNVKEAYISANVSERLDRFLEEYHSHRPEQYFAVLQYSAAQVVDEG